MISIELQILKIEGLDPGTICKVFLDNEEIHVKNYQFSISKHGIVHLEFFKGRNDLGGVFFSSELLSQVAYSYVPIYSPAIFIDRIPNDIDPPRVLLIQTASSLETSMLSSKCETICFEESLESFKGKDDSLDKSFYAYKPELEYTRKAEMKFEIGENSEGEKGDSIGKIEDKMEKIEGFFGKQSPSGVKKGRENRIFRELAANKTPKEKPEQENSRKSLNINESLEKDLKVVVNDSSQIKENNFDMMILIEQLERQRDLAIEKKSGQNSMNYSILTNKIMQDSLYISKLVKEKNQLMIRVKELEKENRLLKNKNIIQDLNIKEVISRENLLRKEVDSKRMIDSMTNGKF